MSERQRGMGKTVAIGVLLVSVTIALLWARAFMGR